MANEKQLIPCGEKCTLDELPCGTIFAFGDDCIAVKSEYRCSNGLIEAFIINSGEQFWGGVHTAKEQNELMVQPLEIEEVDAVEVVHGRWEDVKETSLYVPDMKYTVTHTAETCSACKVRIGFIGSKLYLYDNICPNCGAKMDGDGND